MTVSLEALRAEIRELSAQVEEHGHRYYVLDRPTITDSQYDELFRRLSRLEQEHPELALPNSPTAKVGGPPVEKSTVRHTLPMLSLDNITNPDELADFEQRIQRFLKTEDAIEYVVEPRSTASGWSWCTRTASSRWARPGATAPTARTSRRTSAPSARFPCPCAGTGLPYRNCWRCAAKCSIRRRVFGASTGNGKKPGSTCSPIPATPPPAPSSNWTRRSPPAAPSTCSATAWARWSLRPSGATRISWPRCKPGDSSRCR